MPWTTSSAESAERPTGAAPPPVGTHAEALAALAGALGRPFFDPSLLEQAMAHRSWCAERDGAPSNERLEYLGDAVLGLVVADHVYRSHPGLSEGQLTDARKAVVNASCLAEVAAELGIGEALLLGKGEDGAGGRHKPSILSDALEATIGAVYLDGGWPSAYELVVGLLRERVAEAVSGMRGQDWKTILQELAARRFADVVRYDVVASGPDHAKVFTAQVVLGDRSWGAGVGRSKKQAEQAAAQSAVVELLGEADPPAPG